MKKLKGSLTIFLSLILVFTSGLFFTLSEVVRFKALKAKSDRISDLSVESLFAEYNIPLWEQYGILGVDGSYGDGKFDIKNVEKRLKNNMELNGTSEGKNFLQEAPAKGSITKYRLLTDNNNAAFIKEAALYVESHITESAITELNELRDQYNDANRGVTNSDIENAMNYELSEAESKDMSSAKDPTHFEEEFRKNDLLDSLVPDGKEISSKSISHSDLPSSRSLQSGNYEALGVSPMESVLFKFYLFENFGSYEKDLSHPGISYGQEYLIIGKDSDRENLKSITTGLLAFRVASNNVSILKDSAKKNEAKALASLLGFLSFNEGVIKAIEVAIIESWAFAESVLDVRRMLAGGKVPILKNSSDWTTTIFTIASAFSKNTMAKNSEKGLGYGEYLKILILMMPDKSLSDRALNIIEDGIRTLQYYDSFRVDNLIVLMKADVNFQAKPLFLSYVLFLTGDVSVYDFKKNLEMDYLTLKIKPG